MSIIFKKKSSTIFSPPSYIKGGKLESKVDKIINETIKEKLYNLLDINRAIYIKKVEYFPIFTGGEHTGGKTLKSIMLRVKGRQFKFREILAKEIELSGINILEFNSFLENYGAKEVFNYEQQLENL
tara:strand:- start:1176 stop:1556 length:381 start_codon:yes stop_codon:yes gene_type:complete